jgi:Ca2+-binding EF-hand superfamily protein
VGVKPIADVGASFQQRDTNNAGKLSRNKLPAALFERLDADKDGFVTEYELKTLPRGNP